MDLEQRAIEIRPRSQWEACDLGIQMGRHWWWPMVKIGMVMALPWCTLCWLVPADFALWPLFLFWLGKPLWERLLLHFLGQAIFNTQLTTREVIAAAISVLAKEWLASILWRRLSPWRAYHCALTVLEGQRGKTRRQRLTHLAGNHASTAALVSLLLFSFEWVLILSVWIICYALTPAQFNWNITHLNEFFGTGILAATFATVYCIVYVAVSPFYVSICFALYLNRRIWLEAWDIDISFKSLVKRLGNSISVISLCSCLWILPFLSPETHASETGEIPSETTSINPASEYVSAQEDASKIARALAKLADPLILFAELKPREVLAANFPDEQLIIAQLLAGDDFHHKTKTLVHHLRWKMKAQQKPTEIKNWDGVIGITAKVLEVLMWGLVLVLIFWLALNFRTLNERYAQFSLRRKTQPGPAIAFGLDLRPESLPDQVDEVALRHCQAGEYRQGFALLYRATLVALVQKGLKIKASFTEEDCVAQAGASHLQLPQQSLAYLRELTAHWQNLAYGHQLPTSALAEDLCKRWRGLWQAGPVERA